jgi:hypothetical protein
MGAMKDFLAEVAAEVQPIAREMVNDVRGQVHEAVFDQPENPMESGTPMAPTQREVYEQKHEVEKQPEKDIEREM